MILFEYLVALRTLNTSDNTTYELFDRYGQFEVEEIAKVENKKVEKKGVDKEEYIKGPEKFPLDDARYGYLPISVQKFLHTDNTKCYVSNTNKNVKQKKVCYIRRGVERTWEMICVSLNFYLFSFK